MTARMKWQHMEVNEDMEDPYERVLKFDVEALVEAIHSAETEVSNYKGDIQDAIAKHQEWVKARELAHIDLKKAEQKLYDGKLRERRLLAAFRGWQAVTCATRKAQDAIASISFENFDMDLLQRVQLGWSPK